MSWTSDIWSQNDELNYGFPFISESGLAKKADFSDVKSIWNMHSDVNYGFPFISESGLAKKADFSDVKSIWNFNKDINYGFPYIRELFEVFEWIDPITDRTYSDILNARKMVERKKANSSLEFVSTKAFINHEDLNRIENNAEFLANKANVSGSFVTSWLPTNIPFISDMQRIIKNMADVRDAIITKYPDVEIEELPTRLMDFKDLNQIENVQLQIYEAVSEGGE